MFGTIAPMDRERFGAVELLGDMTISIGCYHLHNRVLFRELKALPLRDRGSGIPKP